MTSDGAVGSRKNSPVTPSTMVSSAPPPANAITGLPARVRLQRRDAEILFAGKEERAATRQQIARLLVGRTSQELHVRFRQRLQPRTIASLSGDEERQAEFVERLHREIDPFIRHEARENQKVIAARVRNAETLHVHRRVNDRRLALIIFGDAFAHGFRNCDELRHALCRAVIPHAQSRDEERQDQARQSPDALAFDVIGVIPEKARGVRQ